MLSDEEKKAIEWLKKADWFSARLYSPTILNLIEKQSKEIEELKDMKKELTERVLRLESDKFWDNVVSKDKIKAKIEEIKDGTYDAKIILQSLLEKE